jgi:ankyrin repeat protein
MKSAIRKGKTEEVRLLLQDPQYDPYGEIEFAATLGQTEIVRLLLDDPRVDPKVEGNYAIQLAAQNGHTDTVRLLLDDRRVDLSTDDLSTIILRGSVEHGQTEIVRLLLNDPRVDPSANDNYAISYAVIEGQTEIVRLLLNDQRVDASANVIKFAVEYGQTEIVRLLLDDRRVDPSVNDNYAIQLAARLKQTEIVRLLLNDPRVDASANDNNALLLLASDGQGSISEVEFLLVKDLKVNPASDIVKRSYIKVILAAFKKGYLYEAVFLVKASRARNKNNILLIGIELKEFEFIRFLINNPEMDYGETFYLSPDVDLSISYAVWTGCIEIATLLIHDPRYVGNEARLFINSAARGEYLIVKFILDEQIAMNQSVYDDAIRAAYAIRRYDICELIRNDPLFDLSLSELEFDDDEEEKVEDEVVEIDNTSEPVTYEKGQISVHNSCNNIITQEDESPPEPNSIQFLFERTSICYSREDFERLVNDSSNWFYECNKAINPWTYTDKRNPYVKLSIPHLIHVPRKNLLTILEHNIRIVRIVPFIVDGVHKKVKYSASHINIGTEDQRDWVSARHCQEGTDFHVYTLLFYREEDVVRYGGKKQRRSIRNRKTKRGSNLVKQSKRVKRGSKRVKRGSKRVKQTKQRSIHALKNKKSNQMK